MSYVTQAELEVLIPAAHLVNGLDDDGDGVADAEVLAGVLAAAGRMVDAYLEGLYATPLTDPIPNLVREAALAFAAELVYARRQTPGEKNPWTGRADGWRARLKEIGEGEAPLTLANGGAAAPVAITEPVTV
jgi:phage gp36-like protein